MTTRRNARRTVAEAAVAVVAALALAACPARGGGHDDHGHAGHAHDDHGHGGGGEAHTDEVKLAPDTLERHGIRTDTVQSEALVPVYAAPARVALDLDATAHVGVQVRGRVRDLRVRRGDRVAKGDVLLVVDSPELGEAQAAFLERRAAAEACLPAERVAKSAYDRGRSVLDAGGDLTRTEVERREAEWRAAEAAVTTARAAAVAAENRLHLLGIGQVALGRLVETQEIDTTFTVVAPISGTVIEREVTLGESVSPDRDALLVLADTTVVWVLAHVPESHAGEVTPGAAVRLRVAAFPGRELSGRVADVPPRIDEATRTAEIRVDVRDAQGLRPGMFAQAEIAMGAPGSPVPTVGAEAVLTLDGRPAVFVPVAGEPGAFTKRAVRVGDAVGGRVPVLEGLAAGDAYVAAGAFLLKAELGKATAEHEH